MNAQNPWRRSSLSKAVRSSVLVLLGLLTQTVVTNTYATDLPPTSNENTENSLTVPVRTYVPPHPINLTKPRYPRNAWEQSIEGWALTNFMVDPQGNTYEIEVTGFGGDKSFVKAAIRAAEQYQYQPARADGEAIHAAAAVLIRFAIEGIDRGAHRSFVQHYRNFTRAVAREDDTAVQKYFGLLENFKTKRLYEMAYLDLARAAYAQHADQPAIAMIHLANAVHWEEKFSIFGNKEHQRLLRSLFWLQASNGHLAEALETSSMIEREAENPESQAKYETAVQQILDLKDSGQAFSSQVTIQNHHNYRRKLLAQAFSLTNIDGALSEGKLYCDKGYLSILVEPQMRYNIRSDYQNCRLVIVGDPGTTFTITEHP
jgi:TonB family protein